MGFGKKKLNVTRKQSSGKSQRYIFFQRVNLVGEVLNIEQVRVKFGNIERVIITVLEKNARDRGDNAVRHPERPKGKFRLNMTGQPGWVRGVCEQKMDEIEEGYIAKGMGILKPNDA